jgi:hypothetical protein
LQARSPRCRTSSCARQSVGTITAKTARITTTFLIQTLLCMKLNYGANQTFRARGDSRLLCTKKAGRLIRSKTGKRQAGAFRPHDARNLSPACIGLHAACWTGLLPGRGIKSSESRSGTGKRAATLPTGLRHLSELPPSDKTLAMRGEAAKPSEFVDS